MSAELGIPEEIFKKISWVPDDYRTNTLSLKPGGVSLVVVLESGKVYGYDKVKMPSKYIRKILISDDPVNIFCIQTVFVRTQNMLSYLQLWSNNESNKNQLLDAIKNYDNLEGESLNQHEQIHFDDSSENWSLREIADLYGYDPSYGQSEEDFLDSQMPDRD